MKEIKEILRFAPLCAACAEGTFLYFFYFCGTKNITTFRVSNQRFMQDCMRNVDTKAVITVRMKLPSFSAGMFLKILIML
jgi:hypothetical protein